MVCLGDKVWILIGELHWVFCSLKKILNKSQQIQYNVDKTSGKEQWSCQACVGKDMERVRGQEERDAEIQRRCVGLKAALAARRGQIDVEQGDSAD